MKVFGLETRKTFPTKLTLDINTHCNAKCIICPYPKIKNKLKHGIMEWNLYQKIIDDFADICYSNNIMGELSYCNMSEPTLLPDFSEFLKYARSKGCFTIYFNTNGSNLKESLIDTFINEKTFPAIHLNIMAFSKINYEKAMGLDFDTLMNNLNYLLNRYPHSLIDIGFFTSLMDSGEISAVKRYFKGTKVKLHMGVDVSDRANNVNLPEDFYVSRSNHKQISLGCSKNRPIHRMHINYDGRVYLCDQDMGLETNFGNIKKNSIGEIWNGKPIMEMLKIIYGNAGQIEPPAPCSKCDSCIDDIHVRILKNPNDYKPRKLIGPFKRWLVRNGLAIIKKRGKTELRVL